jgi:chloramphenicol 3-O phosphotransferase
VRAEDGRAWLTVMWVNVVPTTELVSMEVYERPIAFQPRPPGPVIVLNGPSSVGKSSLMAAFADAAETPWACVDEPTVGRLATKFLAWPATAGPVVDGFLGALAAAAGVGNQLIVSAAGIPQDRFRDALTGIATVYVGLHAPLDILVERQLTQADKFGGLAEQSIGVHRGWEYDLDIDTASHPPARAAQRLSEFLRAWTIGPRNARNGDPDRSTRSV